MTTLDQLFAAPGDELEGILEPLGVFRNGRSDAEYRRAAWHEQPAKDGAHTAMGPATALCATRRAPTVTAPAISRRTVIDIYV